LVKSKSKLDVIKIIKDIDGNETQDRRLTGKLYYFIKRIENDCCT